MTGMILLDRFIVLNLSFLLLAAADLKVILQKGKHMHHLNLTISLLLFGKTKLI